jgi:hypothetical protein
LAKIAIAIRYDRRGILWNANNVPPVTEKSLRQALQRQRGSVLATMLAIGKDAVNLDDP